MNQPVSASGRKMTPLHLCVALVLLGGLLLAACSSRSTTATLPPEPTPHESEHSGAIEEGLQTAEAEASEHAEVEEQGHSETEEPEHVVGEEHEHAESEDSEHAAEAEHEQSETDGHEHSTGETHGVPEEAAAVPNPIDFSDESVAIGGRDYSTNCAVCHGETGEGDGPSAAGLDPRPANLHESHVQDLSDGALFHIITHGVPNTAMPAWEEQLTEDERWHLVNFIRSFIKE
jgi:mono/diheme cytochrome c family protein